MRKTQTLVSLFAGAGGLDLGLEAAGFQTRLANDVEPHACATLQANKAIARMSASDFSGWFTDQLKQKCYQRMSTRDLERFRARVEAGRGARPSLGAASIVCAPIETLSSSEIARAARVKRGELSLVAGGPPCQPFSRAGKRKTVEAEEGRLFVEFVRIVSDLRPRWFLFENVKGLTQSRTEVIYSDCRSCGRRSITPFEERMEPANAKAARFHCRCGSRLAKATAESVRGGSLDIIVNEFETIGYRCTWAVLNAVDFGIPQFRERLFIVGSRDGEAFAWPKSTHKGPVVNGQRFLFADETAYQEWSSVGAALWEDGHFRYGALDLEKARLWVKNVVRPHDEPVTWMLDQPSPTVGAHQSAKLAIAPFGVPEAQLSRQQWHTLGHRQGDTSPVEVEHEYLTDEELLTLQSFPRYWYLFGTRMQRAFQIGNAVPPHLAAAVGRKLFESS